MVAVTFAFADESCSKTSFRAQLAGVSKFLGSGKKNRILQAIEIDKFIFDMTANDDNRSQSWTGNSTAYTGIAIDTFMRSATRKSGIDEPP